MFVARVWVVKTYMIGVLLLFEHSWLAGVTCDGHGSKATFMDVDNNSVATVLEVLLGDAADGEGAVFVPLALSLVDVDCVDPAVVVTETPFVYVINLVEGGPPLGNAVSVLMLVVVAMFRVYTS